MPANQEPRSGLYWGWNVGESGWKPGMDSNILKIGRFGFHPTVYSKSFTDPSLLTPYDGLCMIVGVGAVGDWAGHDNEVTCYDGSQWVFEVPNTGWLFYVEDEDLQTFWDGGSWDTMSFDPVAFASVAQSLGFPYPILANGIPFVMFPGNGSNIGLQFLGSGGLFSLSSAIISDFANLANKGYAYLPANFGGSSHPAGWYWYEMATDTTGTIYGDTYTSGDPVFQNSPSNTLGTLTGWLTQTTAEITALTGYTLLANTVGSAGCIESSLHCGGGATGTKTFRLKGQYGTWIELSTTTNPETDRLFRTLCQGISNKFRTFQKGFGGEDSSASVSTYRYIDNSVNDPITVTIQISVNTSAAVLYAIRLDIKKAGS